MKATDNRARYLVLLTLVLGFVAILVIWRERFGAQHRSSVITRQPGSATPAANDAYGKLPLSFEPNRGQADGKVMFLSRGSGYSLFFTATEAIFRMRNAGRGTRNTDRGSKLGNRSDSSSIINPRSSILDPRSSILDHQPSIFDLRSSIFDPRSSISNPQSTIRNPQSTVLRMELVGANRAPRTVGLEELAGKSNYFSGSDPKRWRAGIPTYAKVKYEGVYPGVDLVYYGKDRQLEYDFVIAPHADPKSIRLDFSGADNVTVDDRGDLVLETAGGQVRMRKPVIYQERQPRQEGQEGQEGQERQAGQESHGERQEISGGYALDAGRQVSFELGDYDPARALVIDPVLVYSTYLGGSGEDVGTGIAADANGAAYVTGLTESANFPTANPAQPTLGGAIDAFIVKLNPAGTAVVYSTYIGGSGEDQGLAIAADTAGAAYVTGQTCSSDFPTKNGFQPASGGFCDAFVTKLDPAGSISYSTYLGGSAQDPGIGIAVDTAGNAYVTGWTRSPNFPTKNPLQPALADLSGDAFVTKLNSAGSALVFSTYLGGGQQFDRGFDVAVDNSGNVIVVGETRSDDFPTTRPLQPPKGSDAFVTKLNASGSAFIYSTHLGGSSSDEARGVAVDSFGVAYVTGITSSMDFPTVNPFQPALRGATDAFVARIPPSGSSLLYSTYLGGSGPENDEFGGDIAVDPVGIVYVTGTTQSLDFPVKVPLQPVLRGGSDLFVASLSISGDQLGFSTYLGGGDRDQGYYGGIALDANRNAYVIGGTTSTDVPTTQGAVQTKFAGGIDAFITKISFGFATVTSVSAASYIGQTLASESIVAAFGESLGTTTQSANTIPLPTTLAGTQILIKDSAGVERPAPLFTVSPQQVNYQIPPGTAVGPAMVAAKIGDIRVAGETVQIAATAPGLFSANANGQGVAAAVALRVKSDGSQSYEQVARFDATQNKVVAVPLDLGPDTDQVFLILFGTGFKMHSGLSAVSVKIGGMDSMVSFAGAQGDLVGLEQANVRVPRALTGGGDVEIAMAVDGKAANKLMVNVR